MKPKLFLCIGIAMMIFGGMAFVAEYIREAALNYLEPTPFSICTACVALIGVAIVLSVQVPVQETVQRARTAEEQTRAWMIQIEHDRIVHIIENFEAPPCCDAVTAAHVKEKLANIVRTLT